jgi:hypothetical protein
MFAQPYFTKARRDGRGGIVVVALGPILCPANELDNVCDGPNADTWSLVVE